MKHILIISIFSPPSIKSHCRLGFIWSLVKGTGDGPRYTFVHPLPWHCAAQWQECLFPPPLVPVVHVLLASVSKELLNFCEL